MTIGAKILNELKKQGKQQKDLAEYVGVKPASISDWATSQDVKFQNVVKASEFLNVSLDYLAYNTENSQLSSIELELLNTFRQLPYDEQQQFVGRCKEILHRVNEQTDNFNKEIQTAISNKEYSDINQTNIRSLMLMMYYYLANNNEQISKDDMGFIDTNNNGCKI